MLASYFFLLSFSPSSLTFIFFFLFCYPFSKVLMLVSSRSLFITQASGLLTPQLFPLC